MLPSRRLILFVAPLVAVALGVTGSVLVRQDAPSNAPDQTSAPALPGDISVQEPVMTEYRLRDKGPAGGIVFYVSSEPFACGPDLTSWCNYLEVAPFESETKRPWSLLADAGGPGRSTDSAIGTGRANTFDIVAQGNTDPMTSAAAYADAYEFGGFDDWYLPSRDECHELTITREVIGGFTLDTYWTSTGRTVSTAWYQDFLNGFQFLDDHATSYLVRPIRAF
jgi:hypothetical protein